MKRGNRWKERGFTLIEILVAVSILLLLAAFSIVGYNYANRRSAEMGTRVEIAALNLGIENFRTDEGRVPSHEEVSGLGGTGVLYGSLYKDGADSGGKVYVSALGPNSKEGWTEGADPDVKIIDGWGKELRYRSGDTAENIDYDLWSDGADGRSNPDDPDATESLDDIH
ncbi:prepilin-type N-terminal cleavage/methylation domain-containing protein [Haloferula sp.]|uniref:prepilin-type N-terminal cleavage/methylation domain-containing protein n=1 Tax=Haloferula sp. TaxID=2497595 RepID=UPI00329C1144